MNKQRAVLTAAFLMCLLLSPAVRADDLDAWGAAKLMGTGVNIGNTLENTTTWETGWGNPRITKEFVESLARLGFKTVRLPVAWDTYARDGRIPTTRWRGWARSSTGSPAPGMFCVVNIHWDGGWIDSSAKERFPKTFATFSAEAEQKYVSYWTQIASHFADRNERLIFEALNEETNFEGAGSTEEGLRHADARQSAVHRHGAQDRRQQREAPAHRHGLRHRHHQDHEQRLRVAQRHRAAPAADLRALLHAVAVRRHDQGRELGKNGADLGQRERRRRAEPAVRCHAGVLQAQRPAGIHRRIWRHRQEGDAVTGAVDVGRGSKPRSLAR